MFKNRNILILVAVLVVLLGINLWQKADHRRSTQQSATEKVVDATFTADQLDRITLGQGLEPEAVDLVATPTGWVLASAWDAPANQQRIDALLRGFNDLSGEFRSDVDVCQVAFESYGAMMAYQHAARLLEDPRAADYLVAAFDRLIADSRARST